MKFQVTYHPIIKLVCVYIYKTMLKCQFNGQKFIRASLKNIAIVVVYTIGKLQLSHQ